MIRFRKISEVTSRRPPSESAMMMAACFFPARIVLFSPASVDSTRVETYTRIPTGRYREIYRQKPKEETTMILWLFHANESWWFLLWLLPAQISLYLPGRAMRYMRFNPPLESSRKRAKAESVLAGRRGHHRALSEGRTTREVAAIFWRAGIDDSQ